MCLKNDENINNSKEDINNFFPYKPYPQQLKLMNFLTKALLNTKDLDDNTQKGKESLSPKIILIESPTGTGKTLMILSSLLEFLYKVKNNDKNNNDDNDEEDWLKNFGNNEKIEKGENFEKDNKKKIEEKMDLILSNIKKKINKKKDNNNNDKLNKEDKKMIIKDNTKEINPYIKFLNSKDNITNPVENQIYFCTRTHSQISQIISEEKKIFEYYNKNIIKFNSMKFPYSFSFLGSRKQLCLNKKINNGKNNLNKINILCREINEEKEKRCLYKKFLNDEDDNKENFIYEENKTEIKDIEDMLKFGEEFNFCPYYLTHILIKSSQIIVSPYNNILNKRIKNNININLRNNIIIFDEAHNIIENILQCANSDINSKELIALLIGFYLYYNRYKSKLNPANNLCLRQIVSIIKIFLNYLQKISKNLEQKKTSESYINIKLSDFTIENKLTSYDFYKLVTFIDESQISHKIQWLLQKEVTNIKNDKTGKYLEDLKSLLKSQLNPYIDITTLNINEYLQIIVSSSPLNKLSLMLLGTLNVDEDGILIYDIKSKFLKFILINPVRDFNNLLREIKCIIFIGGTMKPFDDFYNLFPTLNKNQILTFEGEHIINKGSILPYIISNNILCNNDIYTFTYDAMKKNGEQNIHYLLEFINIYYDLFKKIKKNRGIGIVLFFQSYDLINKIIEYNDINKVIKFENENFFYEKNDDKGNNNIFELFEKNINDKKNVCVLLGVMGGKLSEGINFKDDLCRLLIIVGMPFSNIKALEIQEKMKYYDKLYNLKKSSINGNEYYENICMKNINQTIGRCIRNYYDFSAMILMDNRFTYNKYFNKLPKWVTREGKNIIKNKNDFDNHLLKLESFINNKINTNSK